MFLTVLAVEYLGRGRRRLTRPLRYRAHDGRTIVVPAGFVTDYFSIPRPFRWLFPRDRRGREAAVVHDWLCFNRFPDYPAEQTHRIFCQAMRDAGVNRVLRWAFCKAVELFGPYGW